MSVSSDCAWSVIPTVSTSAFGSDPFVALRVPELGRDRSFAHVPPSHAVTYFRCSSVISSISARPSTAAPPSATARSSSAGTGCTRGAIDAPVLREVFGAQRLEGEREVHDFDRVALTGGEVDEASLAEQVGATSVGEAVLLDLGPDLAMGDGEALEVGSRDLDVEVPRVREETAVLQDPEVLLADDARVARDRDDQVGGRAPRRASASPGTRRNRASSARTGSISVTTTSPPSPREARGDPLAAPAVTGDDADLPGDEEVRRGQDPIDRRLAGAVPVVEEVLHVGVVHIDRWEQELAATSRARAGG